MGKSKEGRQAGGRGHGSGDQAGLSCGLVSRVIGSSCGEGGWHHVAGGQAGPGRGQCLQTMAPGGIRLEAGLDEGRAPRAALH